MRKEIMLALLVLAACNRQPEVKIKNASAEEVAAKVKQSGAAKDVRLQPGQWQVASEMKVIEATGMPQAAADQMKLAMARKSTDLQCITAEQVNKPDVFAGKRDSGCTFDNFEMRGGKISAVMHCPSGPGGRMAMTMNGTYAPSSYTVDAAMEMSGAPGGQGMKMAMHSVGTRIGDCPAGSAAAK
ncbi:MAG TPA: DUF3617 domain-containing protein [Sphingomonas sp.]|nr:DUF3617 domain-containing protein [Sphingomonas sp.]